MVLPPTSSDRRVRAHLDSYLLVHTILVGTHAARGGVDERVPPATSQRNEWRQERIEMRGILLAFCCFFSSCRPSDRIEVVKARLVVADSVELLGTDSAFVARPGGLLISAGQYYVADNGNKTVWHFDSSGRLLNSYGQPGDGPGELRSASDIALIGDSLLAVHNVAKREVSLFSLAKHEYVTSKKAPISALSIRSLNDTLFLGGVYPDGAHSLTAISLASDFQSLSGPVPRLLSRNPILIGPFGSVMFDARSEARVVSFEASDWLFYWDASSPLDSVLLPRVRRRGARVDLLQAAANDTSRGRAALFRSSIPLYVRYISDSEVLVIHGDVDLERSLFSGTFFLSTVGLSPKGSRCQDLQVPVPSDPLPRFFSAGDTLFAVVQHAEGRTFVLRMRIPRTSCQ